MYTFFLCYLSMCACLSVELYPDSMCDLGAPVCQSLARGLIRDPSIESPAYNSISGGSSSNNMQISLQRASLNSLGALVKVCHLYIYVYVYMCM